MITIVFKLLFFKNPLFLSSSADIVIWGIVSFFKAFSEDDCASLSIYSLAALIKAVLSG